MAQGNFRDHRGYVPEHLTPDIPHSKRLKNAIDAANMTEMWDMILTLDYGVASVTELPLERQEEFLQVMSLLLKAFER